MVEGITGKPSTVPESWNPFAAEKGYGFERTDLPLGRDLANALGEGPTPGSAGFTATLAEAGLELLRRRCP